MIITLPAAANLSCFPRNISGCFPVFSVNLLYQVMASPVHILPNEKELFAKASQGDQQAFTAIFDHYMPRIYAYILKYTKSEAVAEDITQDVFAKLWTNRKDLAGIHSQASYIFTTAFRFSINHFRKTTNEAKLIKTFQNGTTEESNVTEETIQFNESNHLVQLAIDQLPPQQKLIYKLNKLEGLSYEEIAEQLQISKNTVRNALTTASQSVRKFISEHAVALLAFLIGE